MGPRYDVEDAEGRRLSLRSLASSAQRMAPGIARVVANPWGTAAGVATGAGLRALGSLGRRAPVVPRSGRPAVTGPAPSPVASPGSSSAPALAPQMPALDLESRNPAASLMLTLLKDRRLERACAALAAGPQGAREIAVDGTVAPPAAFVNLAAWLCGEAAQEVSTTGLAPVDGYLRGPDGSYLTDVASPAARARLLLERMQAQVAGPAGAPRTASTPGEWLLESGLAELVSP